MNPNDTENPNVAQTAEPANDAAPAAVAETDPIAVLEAEKADLKDPATTVAAGT